MKKQKCLNLEPNRPYWVFLTKNALFGYFWVRILKKTIVIFEISSLKFVYLQNFTEKKKCLNLGPKIPKLRIFELDFENSVVIFEICTPEFFELQNFAEKRKYLNLWPKMPYFCVFGLNFCDIWNRHPQTCLIAKFFEKTKLLKFGTKNTLFGYFWARILKNYYHFCNQHPQICQKWVSYSYSEFWYRVRIFEWSGVRFFWRSGSGSGSTL